MLTIVVPAYENYDAENNLFIQVKEKSLSLEHSLVSISKWEAKYHRSFMNNGPKTNKEVMDYIKFMTITQNVNPDTYRHLSEDNVAQIKEYLEDPMTATTFSNLSPGSKKNKEIITAEIIYYWMTALNIPFECQKWHINRLMTLIRVCNIKNAPSKKMKRKDILARNAKLNAERRRALNTRG